MKPQQILNCSLPSWYQNFVDLTIPSTIVKAPATFIQYLLADGLFLPDKVVVTESRDTTTTQNEDVDSSSRSEDRMNRLMTSDSFRSFHTEVNKAIDNMGGQVFPKMNWSAPKDASWIALNNSLCCNNFNDICLLLKSSEFITHDLTSPFDVCNEQSVSQPIEYALVLREWQDLSPAGEYRCFVNDRKLAAVTQRYMQHFKFIEANRHSTVRRVKRFFTKYIAARFPEDSYAFDVHLTGSRVTLIDFNPLCEVTDAILFTWAELSGESPIDTESEGTEVIDGVVFRWITGDSMATSDNMRMYAFPLDMQHLATGEDPAKLIDLLRLQQRQQNEDESTDSSDSNDNITQ